MAEPTQRPVLKRFANLEMDGDPPRDTKPARPEAAKAATRRAAPANAATRAPESDDIAAARRLAASLTANARTSRASTTPQARREERAEQIRSRRMAPEASAPMPRGPETRTLRLEVGQRAEPAATRRYEPIEIPEGATPGVMTIEIDVRPTRTRDVDDGLGMYAPRTPTARAEAAPPPIDLTPMAARQVKLMAWEAGLPGSGLRILTSFTPGLGGPECDFALDDSVQPDDVVFLAHGVRVIVDSTSLEHLRGRRISWHDVPGSEGFAIR